METSNIKNCFFVEKLVLSHSKKKITTIPISFSVPNNRCIALIGRNGSGKTTLLRALLGENVKSEGKVVLFDYFEPDKISARIISKFIAFLPQEHLYPVDLKVNDYLRLAFLPRMGIFGKLPHDTDSEISDMLELFDLSSLRNRTLFSLSSGEKQLVFLARTLLQKPKLLILDEPTNHLDRVAGTFFWNLIVKNNISQKFSIIISTHDLLFVKRYCDWIIALKKGNLFFSGSSEVFWNSKVSDELFDSPINNLC